MCKDINEIFFGVEERSEDSYIGRDDFSFQEKFVQAQI